MKYLIIILLFLSACTKPEEETPPTPQAVTHTYKIETLSNYNRVWFNGQKVYNSELGLNVKWIKTIEVTEGAPILITVGDLNWDTYTLTVYAQDTVCYYEHKTGPINYILK